LLLESSILLQCLHIACAKKGNADIDIIAQPLPSNQSNPCLEPTFNADLHNCKKNWPCEYAEQKPPTDAFE
jgi:hypothetical protein